MSGVGTHGYAWSSSPIMSGLPRAGHLRFIANEMQPLNADGRAIGFPVRCVQHLRAASFSKCEAKGRR